MKALEKLLISNIKTKINFTKAKVSDGFSGFFFILEKVAYMLRIYLGFWSNEKIS